MEETTDLMKLFEEIFSSNEFHIVHTLYIHQDTQDVLDELLMENTEGGI